MKQYHTAIKINASVKEVWKELTNFKDYPSWNPIVGNLKGEMKEGSKISTFIVPLKNTYFPVLVKYKEDKELLWIGTQVSKYIISAEHYYRLKSISDTETELEHGEYFTGLFSYFLSKKLVSAMHNSFEQHNILLKKRIENKK